LPTSQSFCHIAKKIAEKELLAASRKLTSGEPFEKGRKKAKTKTTIMKIKDVSFLKSKKIGLDYWIAIFLAMWQKLWLVGNIHLRN
jgi:hypothetical protein